MLNVRYSDSLAINNTEFDVTCHRLGVLYGPVSHVADAYIITYSTY